MTKVKTILAEFCSPKDILAINRLGLLKKEERESQPIPWRHRLNNRERRELVRSELRMSVRPPSHRGRNEHLRAINSAKCPKDSKMGECLIGGQSKSSSLLMDPCIGKLTNEQRRIESRLQQHKKNFLRTSQCLNHEPLILVERPATPKVKSRASFMKKHGIDPAVVELPRYMRPTQSRSRTPSTLTTIEAFTVDARKKKNLWEDAVEDRDEVKFKSTYRSSARLTDAEVKMLKIGHSLHKPTEESICRDTSTTNNKTSSSASEFVGEEDENDNDDDDETAATAPPPRCVSGRRRKKLVPPTPTQSSEEPIKRLETVVAGSIFITQLSSINKDFPTTNKQHQQQQQPNKLKSVTFSDFGKTEQLKQRKDSSQDLSLAQRKGREIVRQTGKQESSAVFQETDNIGTTSSTKKPTSKKAPPLKKSRSKPLLSLILKS